MLPLDHPDLHPNHLRRPPPGGQCWLLLDPVTLAQHLGLRELVDQCSLDLGNATGAG